MEIKIVRFPFEDFSSIYSAVVNVINSILVIIRPDIHNVDKCKVSDTLQEYK